MALAGAAALTAVTVLTAPSTAQAAANAAPTHAENSGEFLSACRVPGIRTEVRCGVLRRPLDASQPRGIGIDVHVLVVPALARRKLPDPVLLLAGGPGQSAITIAPNLLPLFARLNQQRDIVFIDQRGTGRSAPLQCADAATLANSLSAENDAETALRCRDQLAELPWVGDVSGLRHYTTPPAMADIDAVRRRLGVKSWNVVGGSYGTRAALELMRQAPRSVRRAVLDGVAPADMGLPASMSGDSQAALDALFAACAAEAACAREHPALRTMWAALLARLPERVNVSDPLSGRPTPLTLDRATVLALVRGPLYTPALAAALPQAIAEAARGRYAGLLGLRALQDTRRVAQPAIGMHFSVVCAEDLPNADAEPGADFGDTSLAMYRRVCERWPRATLPDDYGRLGPAASPVLILSGALDPATPPRYGARIAAQLGPLAVHHIAPQLGHGVLGSACGRDLMQRFIEASGDPEALAVDAGCLARMPRPPAFHLPTGSAVVDRP